MVFVRGLANLKVKESVELKGFYAKNWPRYLERRMRVKLIEEFDEGYGEQALRDYQEGTEELNPRVQMEDEDLTML